MSAVSGFAAPFGALGAVQTYASCGAELAFTCGATGHDPQTGRLAQSLADVPSHLRRDVESGITISDVPETRIRAQTLVALDHVARALKEAGSSLARLVRLRVFLRDLRDASSAAQTVKAVLGANAPAMMLVEATGPGTDPQIDVTIDAIGARNDAPFSPRHLVVPGLEKLCGGFPAATLLGPHVFTTLISGADPQTGRVDANRDQLNDEERALLDPEYFNARDEALAVEQVMMWRNVRRVLRAAGVPFENIVHQNNWLAISMQQYSPVTRVRSRLFGRGESRTAATSLPISGLRTPGAAFECALVGVRHDGDVRKEIAVESHGVGPYYVGAVKAGPYVFAAGEVPVRAEAGQAPHVAARAADLRDDLRFLNFGRVHAEYPVMAQAHYVYQLITKALARYECGTQNVLHQSVYLVEPAHFPALERIASLHFGARLPATTLVPIRGASPFRETLLEIEVTALAR